MADNWTRCPQCNVNKILSREQKEKDIEANYGKVSRETYSQMVEDLRTIPKKDIGNTLREDFEIGTGVGSIFKVSYSCSCNECGFTFQFDHSVPVPLRDSW